MKRLVILIFVLFVVSSFATWSPIQDYSNVRYVYYKINYTEYGEEKEMIYGVEIGVDAERYILNYSTIVYLPVDAEISSDLIFGQQFSMMLYTFLNPMLTFIYDAIDLDEKANTKLFGFGTLKYEEDVTVSGRETSYTGTKVALYNEEKELSMYWVLNPDIPFAIVTYMGEDSFSDSQITIQLWDYATK